LRRQPPLQPVGPAERPEAPTHAFNPATHPKNPRDERDDLEAVAGENA
jgi:hypothetical protein